MVSHFRLVEHGRLLNAKEYRNKPKDIFRQLSLPVAVLDNLNHARLRSKACICTP